MTEHCASEIVGSGTSTTMTDIDHNKYEVMQLDAQTGPCLVVVAKRLRRWTRDPLGSRRGGWNPASNVW